jgi:hypothetical protein
MKKILFASIFTLSMMSVKAQDTSYDNIFFTNLFAKGGLGSSAEQPNYHISNTMTGFGGKWGLDIAWFGGIKLNAIQSFISLKSRYGTLYISESGNIGINTESPNATLDVNGNIKTSGNINTSDIISDGSNRWIFHTPDDQRKSLHIAPGLPDGQFDWSKQMTINNNGNVAVNGKIEAIEVKVTQTPTADFVFEENYGLPKLEDVEKHIKEKKHLPEIASAKEMEKEGVNVGEFQIKLLQKIEELTLYSIEQNKKIKSLESENQQIKTLLERVEKLERKENAK